MTTPGSTKHPLNIDKDKQMQQHRNEQKILKRDKFEKNGKTKTKEAQNDRKRETQKSIQQGTTKSDSSS
jgi:hypothetical protein